MNARFLPNLILLAVGAATAAASEDVPVEEIFGAAGSAFIAEATSRQEFALPTVLLFAPNGCLTWSSFGLKEPDWTSSLQDAIEVDGDCAEPKLDAVRTQLEQEGVPLTANRTSGRHVLVWYGSDAMCSSCVDLKRDAMPQIKAALPTPAVVVMVEWK